jgi:hypothetical protein
MKMKILAAAPSRGTFGVPMRHSAPRDLERVKVTERVVEAVKRLCWVLFHWFGKVMALFAGVRLSYHMDQFLGSTPTPLKGLLVP